MERYELLLEAAHLVGVEARILRPRKAFRRQQVGQPEHVLDRVDGGRKEEEIPGFGCTTRHVMQTIGTEWGRKCVGGDVWRSMLTQEYAKQIQKAGGVGLSDQILRDLIQVQAKASPGAGDV